jgi:peptidyl-prolyl cis-trans isomerase C
MSKATVLALCCAVFSAAFGATPFEAALDSVYQLYSSKDNAGAWSILTRLDATASPQDKFQARLELGDFLLDKKQDCSGAAGIYERLAADFPKHKDLPGVLYRLALSQELQEQFLDAARNYEKVATKYSKSAWGTDALDAIERCFRKNYQERVAFVDGFPLTRIELDDRIARNPAAYEKYEKKQGLLDTMIDNRLLYSAALKAGMAADSSFLFNLGEQRNRAMFQEWYERNVNAKAEPSEKELKAAYNKERATKYTTPEKVHAFQIQVKTKAEADELRRQLLADSALAWDSVAKKSSLAPDKDKGGDMGLFARGSQPKALEDAAFRLKVGEVSQPVAVAEGFVLLKVTEKTPKTVRSYADVKTQLSADQRQANVARIYEAVVADLKKKANVFVDTTAIEASKDTLAVVNGMVIDRKQLEARMNAIPPFFRSQFESPEGRRRILDNLVLEKLLMKEAERGKLWLVNKVVDQVLTRRAGLLIEVYKQSMTTARVSLDSAKMMADYKATLAEYREPTKVHAREISARTRERAEQLRAWAVSGRMPATVQGRALVAPDSLATLAAALEPATANVDSIVGGFALATAPALLPGTPVISAGGRNVPDLAQPARLAGPFAGTRAFGFAFNDIARTDRLYKPEFVNVTSAEQLDDLTGKPVPRDTAQARVADPARLGTYVRLETALPADFVSGLVKLDEKALSKPFKTDAGQLVVRITKKDTAQKAGFDAIAKKFSTAASRWSGGDLYWLAKDDKTRDAKLVSAAFALATRRSSS